MTLPALPAQDSTNWYAHYSALDARARIAMTADGGGLEELRTASVTGATTVNLADGNVHNLTLTGNATVALTGATGGVACTVTIILRQDATGSRLVTWPGSVNWGASGAPTLSTAASTYDVVSLLTVDGGTTWIGFHTGMSTAAAPTGGGGGGGVAFSGSKATFPSDAQTTPNGQTSIPSFVDEVWDVDGWHSSASTKRFTVPVGKAGFIELATQIGFATGTGDRQVRIIKNGNQDAIVAYAAQPAAASIPTYVRTSGTDIAVVGDYYEVMVYANSGGSLGLISGVNSWFNVRHIAGPAA